MLIHALQDAFPDKVELTSLSGSSEEGDSASGLARALCAELLAIESSKPRLEIAALELATDVALGRLRKW